MDYQNQVDMKIDQANAALRLSRIEYDKKHSTLQRQKWNAEFDNREFEQQHGRVKDKMAKDLEIKHELMHFELECKNLTEDVLKNRAFNNTRSALSGKKFHSRSN